MSTKGVREMISTQVANEQLVRDFWEAFNDRKWEEATALLHQDFVAEWPQSQERFRGPENYITMNKEYPGQHRIEVQSITASDNDVTSVVHITTNGTQKLFAISFFAITRGKILRVTEYFADACEAPEWRAQWVERI